MSGRFRIGLLGVAAVAGGVGLGHFVRPPDEVSITFLSVGQGDCTILRDGERTVLIDVGPGNEDYDAGARIVAPSLRERGVDTVDLVLLTHPDADHIGGLPGLMARVRVRRIAVSEAFRGHPDLAAKLKQAGVSEGDVIWLRHDWRLRTSRMDLFIRIPNKMESDNDGSPFVKVRQPGLTAVLSGDAGEEAEIYQAGRGDWRADILKAGHHGSASSTGSVWLDEVRPKTVVASCGAGNRHGHPAPSFRRRVQRSGAQLLRTDEDGSITFEARGRGYRRVIR